jgi:hypothetical protein
MRVLVIPHYQRLLNLHSPCALHIFYNGRVVHFCWSGAGGGNWKPQGLRLGSAENSGLSDGKRYDDLSTV